MDKWKVLYVCDGCTNEQIVTTEELIEKFFKPGDHNNPYLKAIVVTPHFDQIETYKDCLNNPWTKYGQEYYEQYELGIDHGLLREEDFNLYDPMDI